MAYLNFGELNIDLNNYLEIEKKYNAGYVITRVSNGHFEKVRSLRVDLKKFEVSSENKRILNKFTDYNLIIKKLPYDNYNWKIHKMGKDFYEQKFGKNIFSANKIQEIYTSPNSNFNLSLEFVNSVSNQSDGYCICFENISNHKIIHYCYPFSDLNLINTSFGIFMMTKAILESKNLGYDYIYLGSVHDPKSKYKLQFKGLEWFDEQNDLWSDDLIHLKNRLLES